MVVVVPGGGGGGGGLTAKESTKDKHQKTLHQGVASGLTL